MSPPTDTFAIIERTAEQARVLLLLDTEVEARAIAAELRKRGIRAEVQPGPE